MSGEKALKLVTTDAAPVVTSTTEGKTKKPKLVEAVTPNETFKGVKVQLPGGDITKLEVNGETIKAKFGELRDKQGSIFRDRARTAAKKIISEVETGKEYTEKDFEKEERGVFVLGIKLKPVLEGIIVGLDKEKPAINLAPEHGGEWFNYRVGRSAFPEGTVFDLFQFELEGHVHSFLVDKESKIWIDQDATGQLVSPWSRNDNMVQHDQGSGSVFYKTKAINCAFYNNVMLKGGEFVRCVISDSSVDALPKQDTTDPFGFGAQFPSSTGRSNNKFEGLYLERSTVVRSALDRGSYFQAHISDSVIESRTHVNLREVQVRNSTVRGTERLVLSHASLHNSHIAGNGQIQVANQTLRDFNLRSEALYATNKLAITNIETPTNRYREIQMVRVDQQSMEISGGSNNEKFKFKLEEDTWDLKSRLDEWLNVAMNTNQYAAENTKASDDPLMSSMIRYVSDTIMSRVRIIKTAQSVVDMADNLESKDSTRNFQSWGSPF